MPALSELPDDDPNILPPGNVKIAPKARVKFYNDLHETIEAHVLDNGLEFWETLDGERRQFRLPRREQIHDFVTLHMVDNVISMVLKIPSTKPNADGTYTYLTEKFEYEPPAATQSNYLPKFSQN